MLRDACFDNVDGTAEMTEPASNSSVGAAVAVVRDVDVERAVAASSSNWNNKASSKSSANRPHRVKASSSDRN